MWGLTSLTAWLGSWLELLGLRGRKGRLAFLGLDNAGKTSLVQVLATGTLSTHPPTLHPTKEEVVAGGVTFLTMDLGGHTQARRVWREYCLDVDGVVFLVDSSDRSRLGEAARELQGVLGLGLPVAVLGNKVDRPDTLTPTELALALGLRWEVPQPEVSHQAGGPPDGPVDGLGPEGPRPAGTLPLARLYTQVEVVVVAFVPVRIIRHNKNC